MAVVPALDRSPDLRELLSKFKKESNVPAIAAGVMRHGVLVAGSCVGVRKLGAPAEVTMFDQFRLGSCTKAMTATVAAGLVDRGMIRWTSALAEIFPERVQQMHPSYRKVSLELLLTHRAGAPRDSHHSVSRSPNRNA
jgi:CubicO group peptidase (beta-lactamase class C family)